MNELVTQILEILAPFAGALLTALCGFAINYLKKRSAQIKDEADNALVTKYADMITETITNCVIAVNQTYVEALKKKNAFTKEAQEEAFKLNVYEYCTEIEDYKTQLAQTEGYDEENFNFCGEALKNVIPDIIETDMPKFKIEQGKLIYIGNDEQEKKWTKEVKI